MYQTVAAGRLMVMSLWRNLFRSHVGSKYATNHLKKDMKNTLAIPCFLYPKERIVHLDGIRFIPILYDLREIDGQDWVDVTDEKEREQKKQEFRVRQEEYLKLLEKECKRAKRYAEKDLPLGKKDVLIDYGRTNYDAKNLEMKQYFVIKDHKIEKRVHAAFENKVGKNGQTLSYLGYPLFETADAAQAYAKLFYTEAAKTIDKMIYFLKKAIAKPVEERDLAWDKDCKHFFWKQISAHERGERFFEATKHRQAVRKAKREAKAAQKAEDRAKGKEETKQRIKEESE